VQPAAIHLLRPDFSLPGIFGGSDLCYSGVGGSISVNQSFALQRSADLLRIPSGTLMDLPALVLAFLAQVTRLLPTTYSEEITDGL